MISSKSFHVPFEVLWMMLWLKEASCHENLGAITEKPPLFHVCSFVLTVYIGTPIYI